MNKKVYLTTPIYYANGAPHIGHFLTTTITDALARYYRNKLGKDNVFFTTGMDEHGTKVLETSEKEGYKNVQDYVNDRAKEFKDVFDKTNITYDYFVRTTNDSHKIYAQNFIKKMVSNGDVYKDVYKGKYCTGCEKFLSISDLDENGYCPDHRKDQVIDVEEENYFFKLSKYALKVSELIENNTIKITPLNKRHEILTRIKQGVDDISISRPKEKVPWGIEFPDDSNQTVYVWVEALINYLSSLEINNKNNFWNGEVNHLLAKEISWFHNLIWPSMLISAGFNIFDKSFVHSFLIVSGKKMSKSLGNVISPNDLLNKYQSDGARYLILSNLPYSDDSDVTWELLDTKYNADLANGIGNLFSRITKLCENSNYTYTIDPYKYENEYSNLNIELNALISEYKLHEVCKLFENQITDINKLIHDNKPWEDISKSKEILEIVLNKTIYISKVFNFILPSTFNLVEKHFSLQGKENEKVELKITHLTGLFPRL